MVQKALLDGEPEVVVLADYDFDEVTVLRMEHARARRRGQVILRCVTCHGPLHPRRRQPIFRDGELHIDWVDLFAHDPGRPETAACIQARGESEAHEGLKVAIYRAANRVAGWEAEMEAPWDVLDPETGHPAILDVLARSPGSEPYAWEPQLSAATDVEVMRRQGLRPPRCAWVTPGRPAWSERVPWLGLDDGRQVVAGVVRYVDGDFVPWDPTPLSRVVGAQLRQSLVWTERIGWYRPGEAVAQPARPLRARPAATSRPTDYCDREPVEPFEPVPLWRPIPNHPSYLPAGEAEYRRAMAAEAALWRQSPHTGPPPGWDVGAETEHLRAQNAARRAEWRDPRADF